jgi:hypothetical protein
MRNVATLFAVLAVALLATGMAYALWDKTLYINSSASMGNVNAGFTEVGCYGIEDKPVGSITCNKYDDDGDGHIDRIKVIIDNAYPGYEAVVSFCVHNYGTVPIKCHIIIDEDPLTPGAQDVPEFNVWMANLEGEQIDVGAENAALLKILINQAAAQAHTYSFDVSIDAMQWNEYP